MQQEAVKQVSVIVMSGGGWKGYLHLGALATLRDVGLLEDVKVYSGSSVGALISFLVCSGITPEDVMAHLTLNDDLDTAGAYLELDKYGISNMEPVRAKIADMCKQAHVQHDITFQQLLQETGKHLIVAVTDVDRMVTRYYNPIDNPCTLCIEAVLASCCIPGVFQARKLEGSLCVDGGWTDNFPLEWTRKYISKLPEPIPFHPVGLIISTPPQNKCVGVLDYIKRLALAPMHASVDRWKDDPAVVYMTWTDGNSNKQEMYEYGMLAAGKYLGV